MSFLREHFLCRASNYGKLFHEAACLSCLPDVKKCVKKNLWGLMMGYWKKKKWFLFKPREFDTSPVTNDASKHLLEQEIGS